ncbi:class I SAM-dependent methyltransferase [Pseudomonas sp. Marseille-Q0931]|uniref:class I SAM-dependent methyltransferase n=1 Tax=Pseudomonas sp. Marseille-Q0931 TaxID=2697507 RepID=UPI0023B9211A|nr:class I SAM-dependent methyltransferase [Pseudomonas sp. Marseille-Q0931]
MKSKDHWQQVYTSKAADSVSWYQPHISVSLELIRRTGVSTEASIIDVGGGASTLVDDLLAAGFDRVAVLDISDAGLEVARQRLGECASEVSWIEADITTVQLPEQEYDVWHDRAVFHFLTTEQARRQYLQAVRRSVKPGGFVIIGTFAEDGPEHCSGLPVQRYSAESLYGEFGASFELLGRASEDHQTPAGSIQKFLYCYCRKVGN